MMCPNTQSPWENPDPGGADSTAPATSRPGMNGVGGLHLVAPADEQGVDESDARGVHRDPHRRVVGRLGDVDLVEPQPVRPDRLVDPQCTHTGLLATSNQVSRPRGVS